MESLVTVMVLGFSVLMPFKDGKAPDSLLGNLQPGTSVFLSIAATGDYVVLNIDKENAKLLKFVDDKCKDMLPDDMGDSSGFFGPKWLIASMMSDKESRQVVFTICTPKYASAGATSVNIEAQVPVNLAKGEKSAKATSVTLAKKTKFEIDGVKFTIAKVEQAKDWEGNDCTEVTLRYGKKLPAMKKFVFKDPATGKEIKADESGSSSMSFGSKVTVERTFRIKGATPVKVADIEMVSYAEIKNVKVDVKQTVSLAVTGQKESKKMTKVKLIEKPSLVTAAGQPPKTIEEFIGKVSSKTAGLSVAKMTSPAGWSEPYQTPEFDEYTLVLSGKLVVKVDDKEYIVKAGQAIIVSAGARVQYGTPKATEYIAVCQPAFSPETVHREP